MGASSQTENANNSYKLVWSDEFDYTGLPDSTKWNYESGHVRNNETQYYEVARLKNSQVKNGHLIITARNDNYHHHGITSASIITKGKMQFLYGKIVVRAKMPVGNGAWSAIWTAGINRDTVHWPLCGEIDILEWVGRGPQYILGSMYMPNYNGTTDTSSVTIYNTGDSSLSSKFHTYALEWDSSQLKYYYDNYNYATYKASDLTPEKWLPFTKPHFLLLNLAMGGESGGVIDETKFPFTYQVDYVRYYQKK
jgi:beta-glucanase (GH16 family)